MWGTEDILIKDTAADIDRALYLIWKYINIEETLNSMKVGPSYEKVKHKRQHDSSP